MNSFDVFIIKGFTVCKITDYYHVRVEKNKKHYGVEHVTLHITCFKILRIMFMTTFFSDTVRKQIACSYMNIFRDLIICDMRNNIACRYFLKHAGTFLTTSKNIENTYRKRTFRFIFIFFKNLYLGRHFLRILRNILYRM